MNFKEFFKNKINITFLVLFAISVVLMLIAQYVVVLMGVSIIMFGIACGFAVPVAHWIKRKTDNSQALENVELSIQQSKQQTRYERSQKYMYIAVCAMLVIFSIVLLYTGIMLYIPR